MAYDDPQGLVAEIERAGKRVAAPDMKSELRRVEKSLAFHLPEMFPDRFVAHEVAGFFRIGHGNRFVQVSLVTDEMLEAIGADLDEPMGEQERFVAQQAQEIARLRNALAYYADEKHYDEHGVVIGRGWGPSTAGGFIQEADYEADFGERARSALGVSDGE